jgi:hypothetical protein
LLLHHLKLNMPIWDIAEKRAKQTNQTGKVFSQLKRLVSTGAPMLLHYHLAPGLLLTILPSNYSCRSPQS